MKDLDHLKLPRAGETSSRFTKEQALAAQKFHQTLPGYSVTRLVELPALAKELGVKDIFGGSEIEKLKEICKKKLGGDKDVSINIIEIKQPDLDAQLVAENIASQLERRISFRRAMKQCIGRTMKLGAKGIKIQCSGRLGGAEIARSETYHEGTIPLQTIRADIDYGFAEAKTTYGRIGVKVWLYKGEVLHEANNNHRRPRRKEGAK